MENERTALEMVEALVMRGESSGFSYDEYVKIIRDIEAEREAIEYLDLLAKENKETGVSFSDELLKHRDKLRELESKRDELHNKYVRTQNVVEIELIELYDKMVYEKEQLKEKHNKGGLSPEENKRIRNRIEDLNKAIDLSKLYVERDTLQKEYNKVAKELNELKQERYKLLKDKKNISEDLSEKIKDLQNKYDEYEKKIFGFNGLNNQIKKVTEKYDNIKKHNLESNLEKKHWEIYSLLNYAKENKSMTHLDQAVELIKQLPDTDELKDDYQAEAAEIYDSIRNRTMGSDPVPPTTPVPPVPEHTDPTNDQVPQMPVNLMAKPDVTLKSALAVAMGIGTATAVFFATGPVGTGVLAMASGITASLIRKREESLRNNLQEANQLNANLQQLEAEVQQLEQQLNDLNNLLAEPSLPPEQREEIKARMAQVQNEIEIRSENINVLSSRINEIMSVARPDYQNDPRFQRNQELTGVRAAKDALRVNARKVKAYFKSEEGLRDMRWFFNSAKYTSIGLTLATSLGIIQNPVAPTVTTTSAQTLDPANTLPTGNTTPTNLNIGDTYDLSSVTHGYTSSYGDGYTHLITEAGKNAKLTNIIERGGETWLHFDQGNGLGYAWIKESDLPAEILKQVTQAGGKSI